MHIAKIDDHIHTIDLEPAGIRGFAASYILKEKHAGIVEPGPASTVHNLLQSLKVLNIHAEKVAYIAVSHIHLDHAGAAGELMKSLPNANLIVHPRGAPHAAAPEKLWMKSQEAMGHLAQVYGRPEPVPEDRIIAPSDGTTFTLGDTVKLRTIETLGHASHHLAYYEARSQGIFPGDAAGIYLPESDAVVPTTPVPYRLDIAQASLQKLISLNPMVLYYSHFGKADSPKEKLQGYVQQLRLWEACAEEGLRLSESVEEISRRIAQKDPAVQKAEDHIRGHPILSQTVLSQSVEGVVEYVRAQINT